MRAQEPRNRRAKADEYKPVETIGGNGAVNERYLIDSTRGEGLKRGAIIHDRRSKSIARSCDAAPGKTKILPREKQNRPQHARLSATGQSKILTSIKLPPIGRGGGREGGEEAVNKEIRVHCATKSHVKQSSAPQTTRAALI